MSEEVAKKQSIDNSSSSSDDEEENNSFIPIVVGILQFYCPFLRSKRSQEPTKGDIYQSSDGGEENYPQSLKRLDHKAVHAVFIGSTVLSLFLVLYSEGFVQESRLIWVIMQALNVVYALGLIAQWMRILIMSKYTKSTDLYTQKDLIFAVASIFPLELIVLIIYTVNDKNENEDIGGEGENPIDMWVVTLARLNYLLRVRTIVQYLNRLEDNMVLGDYPMFLLRLMIYTCFLVHLFACIWNRLACRSFRLKHFLMTPEEARLDVCDTESWMGNLYKQHPDPYLNHPNWHVLFSQYVLAFYWAVFASFRLGAGAITTTLTKNPEVVFVIMVEILSWIYVLVNISGLLSSLMIEGETEKENFLTRVLAIKHYLRFTEVAKSVQEEVYKYYEYLWQQCSGIVHIDLVDQMTRAMKSEVYYNVNKFVMDQMPMLRGLDTAFHMALSVYTEHKFFLAGEIIFRKDEAAADMYYLVKGYFEVLSDDDVSTITTIRSGSMIGEVHLLQPFSHIATVRCGVDCDVLVLSRDNFRRVLQSYPQYIPVMERRLQNRLEVSALVLSLCAKHNTYPKAFKALSMAIENEKNLRAGMHSDDEELTEDPTEQEGSVSKAQSFEKVTRILHGGGAFEPKSLRGNEDDMDCMKIEETIKKKLHDRGPERDDMKTFEEALTVACFAVESDCSRAGSLAKDLNIPRPPLTVRAPDAASGMKMMSRRGKKKEVEEGEEAEESPNYVVMLYKMLKNSNNEGSTNKFLWDTMTIWCTLAVFWFYPYQVGFYNGDQQLDYCFHITDVIFFFDFIYDMIQVVVTPKKSFEGFQEIFVYRIHSFYFYLRFFALLPLEYIFAHPLGIGPPYFYLFKFNRLLLIHQIFDYLTLIEQRYKAFTPMVRANVMLIGTGIYCGHFVAVGFKFVYRNTLGRNKDSYIDCFYRGVVCATTCGYGDILSIHDHEIIVEICGLVGGVVCTLYLQAKVTAKVVNTERQRVFFHDVYYGIAEFMGNRKFPKQLRRRIYEYYDLQWMAHDGTLPPVVQETIWDAPPSTIKKVAVNVGLKYLCRIPLFAHCPVELQTEFCKNLNHYLIPPGQTLMYADELARNIYIIAKGCVEVIHRDKIIGIFSQGRYFGLGGLLSGVNSGFMFRALTYCQILCLTYEDFEMVAREDSMFLLEFKQLQEVIQGKATKPEKKGGKNTHHTHVQISPEDRLVYPPQKWIEYMIKISQHFEDDDELDIPDELLPPPPEQEEGEQKTPDFKPKKKKKKKKKKILQNIIASLQGFSLSNIHFTPNGFALKCWMLFRLICAIAAAVFAPMQLAYPYNPTKTLWVTLGLDAVAWTGMIISSRTAFLGDNNQLITAPVEMLCHYIDGNFMIDFLGCLPADHFAYFVLSKKRNFENLYHVISILRLNRMLQVFSLTTFKSQYLEKSIFQSLTMFMFLELVPIFFIALNFATFFSTIPVCGYTTTGKPINCEMNDAWLMNGASDLKFINATTGLYDQPDIQLPYVIGVYWTTQTVTTIGFGDIRLDDVYFNRLLAVICIFTGVLIMTYIGAKLTSCVSGDDGNKMVLEEKVVLMTEYLELKNECSKSLCRRVNEFYFNLWNKTKGVSPRERFSALPPGLKTDVMRQLYGSHFKTSPLFERIDVPGLRKLAVALQESFYSEGDYLMKYGDLCDDIIYIANGSVCLTNFRGEVMCQLGPGSLIGEIAPCFPSHRIYSVEAIQETIAFVFAKDDFMMMLDIYPHIKATVLECSLRHYKEAMEGTKPVKIKTKVTFENEKAVDGEEKTGALVVSGDEFVDKTRNLLQGEEVKPDEDADTNPRKWWQVFVTFGAGSRDDMGLVHVFQDLDRCNIINFAVHPASPICQWMDFCLILTAISCSITAFDIAFASRQGNQVNWPMTALRFGIEMVYWIRFLGNFHLAYYDESLALITDVKTITKRYAKSVDGLWLDIATCVPFYLVCKFVALREENLKTLQLLRVILFLGYLQDSDSGLSPGSSASSAKIMKISILLLFIFHFYACAWYVVACTNECVEGSWMEAIYEKFREARNDPNVDVPTTSRYFLALYFVTNAFTYTGFSEIVARTKTELMMATSMIFITTFVIGLLVGEMVMCLSSEVSHKIQYQHKLTVLQEHFERLGITSSKMQEVIKYFKMVWCRSQGMQFSELMDELPLTVRADVQFEIYGLNFKLTKLLSTLDDMIIRQLCAKVHHELYLPGNYIIRNGDVCDAMYFIKKGDVVVLDGSGKAALCVEILEKEQSFGEVKILLPREQYRFSYVARLETEVGVLNKPDLEEVMSNHPKIFASLKSKASRLRAKFQVILDASKAKKAAAGLIRGVSSSGTGTFETISDESSAQAEESNLSTWTQ